MGLLADIFSTADTAKRRLSGLLSDPMGTLALGVTRFGEDQGGLLNMTQNAYPMAGNKTVLNSPQQIANFRQQVADKGAEMAMQAATVWHGSPHKFDKFDSSKIGTGEGAQAYGHGLYLAESPAVAESYKRAGETAAPIQFQGEGIMNWALGNRDKAKAMPAVSQKALAYARDFDSVAQARQMAKMNDMNDVVSEIDRLNKLGSLVDGPQGNLYKVDLPDEHIAKMLDWDKQLNQQHPDVQKILNDKYHWDASQSTESVNDLLKGLNKKLFQNGNGSPDRATRYLGENGIPGIRYLDAMSREGGGTSNFVVFPGNEGLLSILERNGAPLK